MNLRRVPNVRTVQKDAEQFDDLTMLCLEFTVRLLIRKPVISKQNAPECGMVSSAFRRFFVLYSVNINLLFL